MQPISFTVDICNSEK